jgi:dihydrofolate reductase
MGKVLIEITMSLDGYTAGPDISDEDRLGRNGERLHDWMFADKTADEVNRFQTDKFASVGAVIVGRRMADLGIGPWGEEPAFHAPCFVVTHRPAETIVKKGGTSYVFVTEGIDAAMERANEAAGDQDVIVMGGADIDRQYLNAGLIDEIRLHVAPMLLGGGTSLFAGVRPDLRLVPSQATHEPLATHLTYQVDAAAASGHTD